MANDAPEFTTQDRIEQTELAIKQVELSLKEREFTKSAGALSRFSVSPVEATVFVGILAFLGSLVGTYIQESNKLALEQQKQESALILDALKGDDPARNLSRLTLLIDTGVIVDKDGAIRRLALSGKYGLVAAPSPLTLLDALAKRAVPQLIQEILKTTNIPPTVVLREANDFPGIATVFKENNRAVLIYDKKQIDQFDPDSSNTWTAAVILAHEIGHVVLGHLDGENHLCYIPGHSESTDCKGRQVLELEADYFSGKVLRRLGASLSQAEQAVALLPEDDSPTHPGREARIHELLKGWRN